MRKRIAERELEKWNDIVQSHSGRNTYGITLLSSSPGSSPEPFSPPLHTSLERPAPRMPSPNPSKACSDSFTRDLAKLNAFPRSLSRDTTINAFIATDGSSACHYNVTELLDSPVATISGDKGLYRWNGQMGLAALKKK